MITTKQEQNRDFDRDNPEEDDIIETPLLQYEVETIDHERVDPDNIRGQLDTGAKVSCTNCEFLLHRYMAYTKAKPSRIRMTAAIEGEAPVTPEGEGYLWIPSDNTIGYVEVKAYYSPLFTSTLIDEDSVMGHSKLKRKLYTAQKIFKYLTTNKWSLTCTHKLSSARDIHIHGDIIDGKCFTHPLIARDLPSNHEMATELNSLDVAMEKATLQAQLIKDTINATVEEYKKTARKAYKASVATLHPDMRDNVRLDRIFEYETLPMHALYIKTRTERLLWHQRLGHPCDEYLYKAHTAIDGVPKFKSTTSIFDNCPTCIRAKQTKNAPNTPHAPLEQSREPNKSFHQSRTAKFPYQGLSIDFSFSGMSSKDSERRTNFEGINGETAWILVTDHFTGMKHGDTRISKAAPILWLKHFLAQYNPNCTDKYVYMDQGGELFNNPEVQNLFNKSGYTIKPTGADASHQNGPVERGHRTIADTMRALLTGADIDVKFWPYAFYHSLRLLNALPERNRSISPLELATSIRENFTHLRTFGCRVWVRPPGKRKAKLKPNSRKGIFLGYVPYTTRNILWYDVETSRIKIATHA